MFTLEAFKLLLMGGVAVSGMGFGVVKWMIPNVILTSKDRKVQPDRVWGHIKSFDSREKSENGESISKQEVVNTNPDPKALPSTKQCFIYQTNDPGWHRIVKSAKKIGDRDSFFKNFQIKSGLFKKKWKKRVPESVKA